MTIITVIVLNDDYMNFADGMPIFGENSGASAPIVRIERRLFQMFKFGVEPRLTVSSSRPPTTQAITGTVCRSIALRIHRLLPLRVRKCHISSISTSRTDASTSGSGRAPAASLTQW